MEPETCQIGPFRNLRPRSMKVRPWLVGLGACDDKLSDAGRFSRTADAANPSTMVFFPVFKVPGKKQQSALKIDVIPA